jgi:RNA polymerase sigma factor for flagellar operon FliA
VATAETLEPIAHTYVKNSPPELVEQRVLVHMPAVRQLVQLFVRQESGQNRFVDDYMSASFEALVMAAQSYDSNTAVPFWQFAQRRVAGALLDQARINNPLTRSDQSFKTSLQNAVAKLSSELNRTPTEEEVAAKMEITTKVLRTKQERTERAPLAWLDEPRDVSGVTLLGFLAERMRNITPGQAEFDWEIVQAALAPDEQFIIWCRANEVAIDDVARAFGVTESRISQMGTSAFKRLKFYMETGVAHGRRRSREITPGQLFELGHRHNARITITSADELTTLPELDRRVMELCQLGRATFFETAIELAITPEEVASIRARAVDFLFDQRWFGADLDFDDWLTLDRSRLNLKSVLDESNEAISLVLEAAVERPVELVARKYGLSSQSILALDEITWTLQSRASKTGLLTQLDQFPDDGSQWKAWATQAAVELRAAYDKVTKTATAKALLFGNPDGTPHLHSEIWLNRARQLCNTEENPFLRLVFRGIHFAAPSTADTTYDLSNFTLTLGSASARMLSSNVQRYLLALSEGVAADAIQQIGLKQEAETAFRNRSFRQLELVRNALLVDARDADLVAPRMERPDEFISWVDSAIDTGTAAEWATERNALVDAIQQVFSTTPNAVPNWAFKASPFTRRRWAEVRAHVEAAIGVSLTEELFWPISVESALNDRQLRGRMSRRSATTHNYRSKVSRINRRISTAELDELPQLIRQLVERIDILGESAEAVYDSMGVDGRPSLAARKQVASWLVRRDEDPELSFEEFLIQYRAEKAGNQSSSNTTKINRNISAEQLDSLPPLVRQLIERVDVRSEAHAEVSTALGIDTYTARTMRRNVASWLAVLSETPALTYEDFSSARENARNAQLVSGISITNQAITTQELEELPDFVRTLVTKVDLKNQKLKPVAESMGIDTHTAMSARQAVSRWLTERKDRPDLAYSDFAANYVKSSRGIGRTSRTLGESLDRITLANRDNSYLLSEETREGATGTAERLRSAIFEALKQLAPSDAELLRAIDFEGVSPTDFASRTGQTTYSVRLNRRRSLFQLKKIMEGTEEVELLDDVLALGIARRQRNRLSLDLSDTDVNRILNDLPPRARQALSLYANDKATFHEIGQSLGLTANGAQRFVFSTRSSYSYRKSIDSDAVLRLPRLEGVIQEAWLSVDSATQEQLDGLRQIILAQRDRLTEDQQQLFDRFDFGTDEANEIFHDPVRQRAARVAGFVQIEENIKDHPAFEYLRDFFWIVDKLATRLRNAEIERLKQNVGDNMVDSMPINWAIFADSTVVSSLPRRTKHLIKGLLDGMPFDVAAKAADLTKMQARAQFDLATDYVHKVAQSTSKRPQPYDEWLRTRPVDNGIRFDKPNGSQDTPTTPTRKVSTKELPPLLRSVYQAMRVDKKDVEQVAADLGLTEEGVLQIQTLTNERIRALQQSEGPSFFAVPRLCKLADDFKTVFADEARVSRALVELRSRADELAEPYRTVVVMHDFDEATSIQISDATNLSALEVVRARRQGIATLFANRSLQEASNIFQDAIFDVENSSRNFAASQNVAIGLDK